MSNPDTWAVYAIREDWKRVRVSAVLPSYDDALDEWNRLDTYETRGLSAVRIRGDESAVWIRHYEVRPTTEHLTAPVGDRIEVWNKGYASDVYAAKKVLQPRGFVSHAGGWVKGPSDKLAGQGWKYVAERCGVKFTYRNGKFHTLARTEDVTA